MYVDLTHPIKDGMQTFPGGWHARVALETLGRLSVEERRTTRIALGSHTGTHIDAPAHFLEHGATIDAVPLDVLLGRAVVVDVSDKVGSKELSLGALQDAIGNRVLGPRTVLRYRWSNRYNTSSFYRDSPYLSEEAANFIIDSGVFLLGYDTPSPDNPEDNLASGCDSPIHRMLLGAGIWLLEYMNNLEALGDAAEIAALPMSLHGVDGAPTRVVARVSDV